MSKRKVIELICCGVPPERPDKPAPEGLLHINREVMKDVLKRYEPVPYNAVFVEVKIRKPDGEIIAYSSPNDRITSIKIGILESEMVMK